MAIATLIAAGRLDDSLIARVRDALAERGVACGSLDWIDEGDAADLTIDGDLTQAHDALLGIDGLDFAVQPERVPARLFVADMDSTMIGQECIDELADYAGLKEKVAVITERAMQGELDFATALAERVALLKGLDVEVLSECLSARIRPNPGAATLLATMKSKGATTVLVSGGFTAFVQPVAVELGFDRMRANVLEAQDGKLTGRTAGEVVDAAAKRRVAEATLAELHAGADQLVAIGDGANDIPMVGLAGLGIGYRPKPALAEAANGLIRFHDLTAVLWMQGIPKREWDVR